jgi:hypothetical protein
MGSSVGLSSYFPEMTVLPIIGKVDYIATDT